MDEKIKIVITTLVIRLLFAPFFGHIWDINTLQVYSYMFTSGVNIYEYTYNKTLWLQNTTALPIFYEGYAYLPHPLLIYAPFYLLYLAFTGIPLPIRGVYDPSHPTKVVLLPDAHLFLLIIKLPAILADVLIVLLLYKYYRKEFAWIYALSSYSIFIVAIWGMFDNLVALLLLATLLLLERKRFFEAGVAYSISLMKFYSVFAFPPIIAEVWRNGRLRSLRSFIFGALIAQLPSFYFFLLNPKAFLATTLLFHGLRSGGGVTPVNTLWMIYNTIFNIAISKTITAINIGVWLVVSLYVTIRRAPVGKAVVTAMMAGIFFGKIVNEQYLLSIYPLLLILLPDETPKLDKYLLVFAMFNSTPLYFAIPLLYHFRFYRELVFKWYEIRSGETLFAISSISLFIIGVLLFLKVLDCLIKLIGSSSTIHNNR